MLINFDNFMLPKLFKCIYLFLQFEINKLNRFCLLKVVKKALNLDSLCDTKHYSDLFSIIYHFKY